MVYDRLGNSPLVRFYGRSKGGNFHVTGPTEGDGAWIEAGGDGGWRLNVEDDEGTGRGIGA
ncbi:hypothetical protein CUMW_289110 [Citrus unshiu]|uniref:Uncharacterized protein n=1 Tax=Citrus unshiu TaxID=55188 RepID=A0A2H5QY10_CITUN|nr:hypothetical protein CUMW_289110 [Citrus unshiu]